MKNFLVLALGLGVIQVVLADPAAYFPPPTRGSRASRRLSDRFRDAWKSVFERQFPAWSWDFGEDERAPPKLRTRSQLEDLSTDRPGVLVFAVCLEEAQRKESSGSNLLNDLLGERAKRRRQKNRGSHSVRLQVALDGAVRYDERHRSDRRGYPAEDDDALAATAGRRAAEHLLKHWAATEGVPWKVPSTAVRARPGGRQRTPEEVRRKRPLGAAFGAKPTTAQGAPEDQEVRRGPR